MLAVAEVILVVAEGRRALRRAGPRSLGTGTDWDWDSQLG